MLLKAFQETVSHTPSLPSKGRGRCDVSASALSSDLLCPYGQMRVAIGVDRRFLQVVTSGEHQREVGGWLTLPAILCSSLFFSFLIILFIYFWLRWVFVAVSGLLIVVASLVAEHGL